MFYTEEFDRLAEGMTISLGVALSDPQEEDNWNGLTGFIHGRARELPEGSSESGRLRILYMWAAMVAQLARNA